MSAIASLLRVMTLRDAEAMVLETGKVPSLRRRGAVEQLAMPALEPGWLDEFVAPLGVTGDGPQIVAFRDDDGTAYQLTVERPASGGLRVAVRKGAPSASAKPAAGGGGGAPAGGAAASTPASVPAPAPPSSAGASAPAAPAVPGAPTAWWAKPATPDAPPRAGSIAAAGAASLAAASAAIAGRGLANVSARLAQLLAGALTEARERGASDVIISEGQPPRMRLDGRLTHLDARVDGAQLSAILDELGDGADLSLEVGGARARVNAFRHLGGAAIAARLIQERVPSLMELGLPAELAPLVDHREGLVLVCGPTGSGKSSTLAAMIQLVDQRRPAHVITLEDPIEFRFRPTQGLVHQREIGTHAASFAAGLRAALRESPDVILLGELRDRETIAAALTAAETGHLVLATLHAPSAVGAIDRVIDAFPEGAQRQIRWQLAASLRAVVTQYLLRRQGGGRAPAIELVPATPAVCNIIRKGDLHTLPTAIQSGRDAGMIPLERSLARLLDSGEVSRAEVQRVAADHDLMASLSGPGGGRLR